MNSHAPELSFHLAVSRWAGLALVLLLSVSAAALVSRRAAASLREGGAQGPGGPLVLGTVFVVNSTGDEDDAAPGNGTCETSSGNGVCTLRAAIEEANAHAGDDAIHFQIPSSQPGCNSSTGQCAITLTKALPDLSTNINITGPGASLLTVRRDTSNSSNLFRVFNVTDTGTVNFTGLTVSFGQPASNSEGGGGLHNAGGGTVNINACVFSFNTSVASGASVMNTGSGTVNIVGSTFTRNDAGAGGGSIANAGAGTQNGGTLNVTNSTVFGNNSASSTGGGIDNNSSGTVNVSNCTLTRLGGRALVNNTQAGGSLNVKSTIVDGGFFGVTSAGFNLVPVFGQGDIGFDQPTDLKGTPGSPLDPKFDLPFPPSGGPKENGGAVPTIAILCGSPALDRGTSAALTGALTTDERGSGFPRTFDDPGATNATGGDGTDIGAFELQQTCPHLAAGTVVNSTGDADDANPGDGVCDSDAGVPGQQCTLRAIITEVNALVASDTVVNFAIPTSDPGFDAASGRYTINLRSALPDIKFGMTFNGPGAGLLTVRRETGVFGIFTVKTTGTVNFLGLTVSNGSAISLNDAGGGIHNADVGTVNVNGCVFTDNNATQGGAIFGANLNINNSTFIGNSAGSVLVDSSFLFSGGGAIQANGVSTIANSTFIGNTAATVGGAVKFGSGVHLSLVNDTFIDNSAEIVGGAVCSPQGHSTTDTLEITGSTFEGNVSTAGGAIFSGIFSPGAGNVDAATVQITNSTLTRNTAFLAPESGQGFFPQGGAIYNAAGSLVVTNSTIARNSAEQGGGGIFNFGGDANTKAGKANVKSSIVASNTDDPSSAPVGGPDLSGAFTSGGFNLVGVADGGTGFTQATDQTGSSASPLDPKLDPAGLQNNGGPTLTIALLASSPAIDKGTSHGLTGDLSTDQRGAGFARTFDVSSVPNAAGGDGTDVGAFEFNPAAPTPTPTPSPSSTPSPTPTPTPTPAPPPSVPTFQFDSSIYAVQEGVTFAGVRVLRTGPSAPAVSVDVASDDGSAKQKGDFEIVSGHLSFAAGETEKTFFVLINDDGYTEGPEFATVVLQHPSPGAALGSPATATLQITDNATEPNANPIDDSRTFVGQHYHDFLYRQSDQAGEDFWTNRIESCGASASCRQARRVEVSTAFFLSIEFKETGYFLIRAHKAAFGNAESTPRYVVFLRDQREVAEGVIVGQTGFQQRLEANKQNYLADFVSRPEFVSQFPQGMAAAAYVDKLFQNAGATPTQNERAAALTAYGSGDAAGRAAALRSVVESGSVFNAEYNPAFVLMQYYGYLRRNPDDAPDFNFGGYDFWLAKLNSVSRQGEDMRDDSHAQARVSRAEMVRAFIESVEYRQRFGGSPVGNQLGAPVSAGAE
jgi:CSLREA domain-containing protein